METVRRVCFLLPLLIAASCRNSGITVVKSHYLGMEIPGKGAEVYGPGLVSTAEWSEYGGRFSADLQEFRFVREDSDGSGEMFVMSWLGSGWSDPAHAGLAISRDRVPEHEIPEGDGGMMLASFTTGQWENADEGPLPEIAFLPEQAGTGETGAGKMGITGYGVCCTDNLTLYFSAAVRNPETRDICFSRYENGAYTHPERCSTAVNSTASEVTVFVTPDDDLMLFSSDRRGGVGGYDLYLCRRIVGGEWSAAVNLGPAVNTAADEMFPYLLPDASYLLFSRISRGKGDIYWVAASEVGGIAAHPESVVTLSARSGM